MKANTEKKQPRITLTNTAIEKAAAHCPAVMAMSRQQRIDWLRNALAWATILDSDKTHPDIDRALLLPDEWQTDLGDRLVAVCVFDEHDRSALVVTTVKAMRACLRTERKGQDEARTPVIDPSQRAAALAIVRDPVVAAEPAPAPKAAPSKPAIIDNRGAQSLRMEIAKRGISQAEAGALVGVKQPHMNNLLRGRVKPSDTLAIAVSTVFSVPVEAWQEAVA
jgi:DNA-binding XRE family transcriptional regulator